MNKLINRPEELIEEMLEGYLMMYGRDYGLKRLSGVTGLVYQRQRPKVSIVIAGGAGNEPWVMGFVGQGLADGAALGAVYTAPPAKAILKVTEAVYHQQGVLFLSTNHTGDVLNFGLVSELAELKGIRTKRVFVGDDVASADKAHQADRRGVAGIALVVKLAGAACDAGYSLEEVYRVAEQVASQVGTYSVTTSSGYMPGSGRAMFELPSGEIEFGMGFNGEPGDLRTPLLTADEIAERVVARLLKEVVIGPKEKVVAMINGFGFTSLLELCIVARKVGQLLADASVVVHDLFVDHLFMPQGTGGFSLTLLPVEDELISLYDAPAKAPYFKREGR